MEGLQAIEGLGESVTPALYAFAVGLIVLETVLLGIHPVLFLLADKLFDRLFGTWSPEEEAPVFGLVKDWHGYGLWDCQVHELRDLWRDLRGAPTLGLKVQTLFRPPSWRPS